MPWCAAANFARSTCSRSPASPTRSASADVQRRVAAAANAIRAVRAIVPPVTTPQPSTRSVAPATGLSGGWAASDSRGWGHLPMNLRPTFRHARFDDVRSEPLGGWYAVVDSEAGVHRAAQLVFLPGFRGADRPRLVVEFEPAAARDAVDEPESHAAWTGPFPTREEALAEG